MRVAVVGTGISGLTLALRLQQLGVETTVFTERPPEEMRTGRLENLVARFPATQEREHLLGVAHWDDIAGYETHGVTVEVAGTPLRFRGQARRPVRAVDFRTYLSRLADDYVGRGGRLLLGRLPEDASQLAEATRGHEAVVVAAGRGAPLAERLFPVRADRSPYSAPQRRLTGGLFWGVASTDPRTVSFTLVPGAGEIFQQPFLTDRGVVAALLVEAVPGGALEPATQLDLAGDPHAPGALLRIIEQLTPTLAARIDGAAFAPLSSSDVIRGAVTPTARAGHGSLPDGRLALAIGDAWVVNDPITGQGANIGSHCAWLMAEELAAADGIDRAFAERLEDDMWAFAGPVTGWTNGFLQPPPPHVMELLEAATRHQSVADAFSNGFAQPVALANALASPDATSAFIRSNLDPAVVG